MDNRVTYELRDGVATIAMDDGKVNALSLGMLGELNAAFDRAEEDGAVVVLTGREGTFSAGFDLTVLRGGGADAEKMLNAGLALGERLLSFPSPVVVASTGHAIAMGVFLVVAADYRVGASGPFRYVANEVAIGLTVPHAAVEICRHRLAPAHLDRVLLLAETYAPDDALAAGFLDRVVAPGDVLATAQETAAHAASLVRAAHTGTKARVRKQALAAVRAGLAEDATEFARLFG